MAKLFTFSGDDLKDDLIISIPQVLDASYGMYVWPAAPVLAQFIWHNREEITNKTMLEIGAGTALPGVVAAKCGSKVILSDAKHYPSCLENCRKSLEMNAIKTGEVHALTWGHYDADSMLLPPIDIILGSDCFYDSKDYEDILFTISLLMEKNPKAQFWTTYQERGSGHCIMALLEKWGLRSYKVPLQLFQGEGPSVAGSDLPGAHEISMWIITKA